jgi:outer membrane protein OmpA-like peptidoglycan-associated protein
MRSNYWRWLWGLPLLALIAAVVNFFERPRIEGDLKLRTQQILTSAGLRWASVSFDGDGRDGHIVGTAPEEREKDRVHDLATQIWGVRTVDNRAKLLERADRYTWSVTKSGAKIKVAGLAPSESVRSTILDEVRGAFPGIAVEDGMRLARGVPDRNAWLDGVRFALRQLAGMSEGKAELDNLELTISGQAASPRTYSELRTALARLPGGIVLKRDRIEPALVKPYTLAALLQRDRLLLRGYVPSEAARDLVVREAKRLVPGKALTDELQAASGAPRDWERAVMQLVALLGQLEAGKGEIIDTAVSVSGSVAEETTKEQIVTVLARGLPPGFRGSEQISFRIARLPTFSPYVTTFALDAGAVVVTGAVPSEELRRLLIANVAGMFPRQKIEDRLVLGSGQIEAWLPCTQAGVRALRRLGSGRFELRDSTYTIAGETIDENVHQNLSAEVGGTMPRACSGRVDVTLRADTARIAERQRAAEEERARQEERAREDERLRQEAARRRAQEEEAARQRLLDERRVQQDRQRQEEERVRTAARMPSPVPVPAPQPGRVDADRCQKALDSVARSEPILFDRYKTEVSRDSYALLDKVLVAVNSCPGLHIEIGGHTDARGGADLNERLSRERAQAVAEYLVGKGVERQRLSAVGYGPSRPIAANDTPENRALNRRIEFVIKP